MSNTITTKAIQLSAKTVFDFAQIGIAKIDQIRESKQLALRSEWLADENFWRSRLGWLGVKLVTDADFNADDLPTHQSFWYYTVGNSLYSDDEKILDRLMHTASLSMELGDGMIWLSSNESYTLSHWRYFDLSNTEI
jgi:hypothetical protein